jgi:hypothetical protein
MANWAQNWLTFSGQDTKLKEVQAMFQEMEQKGEETNEGQKPVFLAEVKQDYFFNICSDVGEESFDYFTVNYDTKYSPNIEDVIEIANHFNLNFELTYQETGCCIFGKAILTAGNSEAQIFDLDNADFDLYECDDEGNYTYKGEFWESYDEILEDIFKEKFNQDY